MEKFSSRNQSQNPYGFAEARINTRKLDVKELNKNEVYQKILAEFIATTNSLPERYSRDSFIQKEKLFSKLKNYVELLVIRNKNISPKEFEEVLQLANKYNLDTMQIQKLTNLYKVLSKNSAEFSKISAALSKDKILDQAQTFKILTGKEKANYPSLKVTPGPIGFEIRGELNEINKLYRDIYGPSSVLGYATEVPLKFDNRIVNVLVNYFGNNLTETYIHELQHNINKLMKDELKSKRIVDQELILRLLAKNPKDEKKILQLHYESVKNSLLFNFGDEFLAQLRGNQKFENIKYLLGDKEEPGRARYNFLYQYQKATDTSIGQGQKYYYSEAENRTYSTDTEILPRTAQMSGLKIIKINGRLNKELRDQKLIRNYNDETRKILELSETILKKGRFNREELINILATLPVDRWVEKLYELRSPAYFRRSFNP